LIVMELRQQRQTLSQVEAPPLPIEFCCFCAPG
jgi:hypothetical protein